MFSVQLFLCSCTDWVVVPSNNCMCFEHHFNPGWRNVFKPHFPPPPTHTHTPQYYLLFLLTDLMLFIFVHLCSSLLLGIFTFMSAWYIVFMSVQSALALWSPHVGKIQLVVLLFVICNIYNVVTFIMYVVIFFFSSSWCHWIMIVALPVQLLY